MPRWARADFLRGTNRRAGAPAELFGQGQGGAFGDAVTTGMGKGDGRPVAQAVVIHRQVRRAEAVQRQVQPLGQGQQARFILLAIKAGQGGDAMAARYRPRRGAASSRSSRA